MRDSMIIYRSFFEAIKELPKNSQADVWNAIFEYSLNFKEIKLTGLSNTIFTLIKPQLDANNKRYSNGKQPKDKKIPSEDEANDKQNGSETEANNNKNENKNENANGNLNGNYNEKVFSEKPDNNFPKVDEAAREGTPPFNAVKEAWFEYHENENLPRPTLGTWDNQKFERIASRISQKIQAEWKSPTHEAVKDGMFAMIHATKRHQHWKKSFSLSTIENNFDEIFNGQKKKNDIFDTSHIG